MNAESLRNAALELIDICGGPPDVLPGVLEKLQELTQDSPSGQLARIESEQKDWIIRQLRNDVRELKAPLEDRAHVEFQVTVGRVRRVGQRPNGSTWNVIECDAEPLASLEDGTELVVRKRDQS